MDEYEEFMANFDENWADAMEELKSAIEELEEEELEGLNFKSKATVRIDEKDRLRQLSMNLT